jgi:hypothetical protein
MVSTGISGTEIKGRLPVGAWRHPGDFLNTARAPVTVSRLHRMIKIAGR